MKRYPAPSAAKFKEMVGHFKRQAERRAVSGEDLELVRTLAVLALAGFRNRPVPPLRLSEATRRVLDVYKAHGPMTVKAASASPELAHFAPATVSGRTSWLVGHGFLRDSGQREATDIRHARIVYEATPEGEQ